MIQTEALAVAILGGGGALVGILGLLRPHWTENPWFRMTPLAIAGLAGALAFAGGSPLLAWLPLGLVGFWTIVNFGDALIRAANHIVALVRRPRLAWAVMLLASPLLAVAWSHWTIVPEEFWEPPQIGSVSVGEVAHGAIRTDAGRILRVAAPVRSATEEELKQVQGQTAIPNLICTDNPGVDYNCHGWVFTGGRYWLTSADVTRVLEDNGYVEVKTPAPGDIIIYYNDVHEPIHTGLVRASDELGIIIESKWDLRGRYIHLPGAQDYATKWVYYHSDRTGHLLAGIQPEQRLQAVSVKTRSAP